MALSQEGGRIIMFGTEANLNHLRGSEVWAGMELSDPAQICSTSCILFVISDSIGAYHPCTVSCQTKKGGTYNKLFGVVRDLVQKGPNIILIDYEAAALNAIKEKMNPTQSAGCYFHLGQCVDREVSELCF